MGKYLVGIDEGTTGCKACVFDLEGNIIGSDYREYPCYFPNERWVEQKAEDITPALFESCKAAIAASGADKKEIVAMALSTQGSAFEVLDGKDNLLRPFIGWQDSRGVGYYERIMNGEFINPKRYYEIARIPMSPVQSVTKYMWYKEHEPELYAKTAKISQQQDFFLKEFGADDWFVNDTATACRTGVFDVANGTWSKEIIDAIGLDISQFPKIVKAGTVVGKISHDIAIQTGLAEGTLICVGSMDQNCSTLGAGLVRPGTAVTNIGTYGAVFAVLDKPYLDTNGTLVVKRNSGPENYTIEAASIASASCYKWFRDTFCRLEKIIGDELKTNYYDIINRGIAEVPPGANRLTFIPYLAGAGWGPRSDPFAKGVFLGLTISTTKQDIGRAVLEGITIEMRDNIESIRRAIDINDMRVVGGATKSKLWNQMQADMYKLPVQVPAVGEAGCLGAAIYAGIGAGVYKDFSEATANAVKIKEVIDPNPANYAAYDAAYERFVLAFEGLKSVDYFKKTSV
jgi:xylulokinase